MIYYLAQDMINDILLGVGYDLPTQPDREQCLNEQWCGLMNIKYKRIDQCGGTYPLFCLGQELCTL